MAYYQKQGVPTYNKLPVPFFGDYLQYVPTLMMGSKLPTHIDVMKSRFGWPLPSTIGFVNG